MEIKLCVDPAVWRDSCSEIQMYIEQAVRINTCVGSKLCGEPAVWRASCVESQLFGGPAEENAKLHAKLAVRRASCVESQLR